MINDGNLPDRQSFDRERADGADRPVVDCALLRRTEELRLRLALLAEERVLALESGLLNNPAYREDLELEINHTRVAHDGMVVTQLALLRADLDGRNWG